MAIKLTLTVKPLRRSPRLAARKLQARHQPYPERQTSGSQPTPPPQARASSPVVKREPRRTSSPVIKREESRPPPNIIPFTPINAAAAAPKRKPKKDEEDDDEEEEDEQHWEINLHSIPRYFPALGPNTGSEHVDPRYIPGNFILDERGVERRVLGRGEVASLTTMQCWENGALF